MVTQTTSMMATSMSMSNPIGRPQNASANLKISGAGAQSTGVTPGSEGKAGMTVSVGGEAKTSYPKMPDDMNLLIAKKVTKEVKSGLTFGQLKVTTTVTLLPDQIKFLGPTMTRDFSSGPLKTVLRESIQGIHKKKAYKITHLAMNYVKDTNSGNYLRITITSKRL